MARYRRFQIEMSCGDIDARPQRARPFGEIASAKAQRICAVELPGKTLRHRGVRNGDRGDGRINALEGVFRVPPRCAALCGDRREHVRCRRQHVADRVLPGGLAAKCRQRLGDLLGQRVPVPVRRCAPPRLGLAGTERFLAFQQLRRVDLSGRLGGQMPRVCTQRPVHLGEGFALEPPSLWRPHRDERGLCQTGDHGQQGGRDRRQSRLRVLDDQQQPRRPGEESGGCADRPLHAREEAPQRDHDHEHDAVTGGESTGQHGDSQLDGDREHDRHPSERVVLQRDRARDRACRGGRGRRPHRPPEQGGRRQHQNAEKAPRDRAVVRQVQSESQSLGHPIILTRPRPHAGPSRHFDMSAVTPG